MGTLVTPAFETLDLTQRRSSRRETAPLDGIARLAGSLFRKPAQEDAPALGKALLVTAATCGEGVSTVTRHLANYLSDNRNQRVLRLTPSELAHAETFALEQVDLLLSRTAGSTVWTLLREPAGKIATYGQARMTYVGRTQILEHFRKQFDCVLLDAPSVGQSSELAEETLLTCALADSVLMVVAAGRSTRMEIGDARQAILGAGGKIEGCCLNRRRNWIPTFLQRWFGR